MRLKILELKKAIEVICATYTVDTDSIMEMEVQNDNPGEGKITDIVTLNVAAKDGTSGLMLEVYGASENKPPRSIFTKVLVDKKPEKHNS